MSFNTQLKEIKSKNQDFEWYPTDTRILEVIKSDLGNDGCRGSFLDIGCGDGKVLKYFQKAGFSKLYAIEKSLHQLSGLPSDFLVLGVDFLNTTLIDKSINVIFCNPPYSEYEEWVAKIIKESRADTDIYLVIPQRWKNNDDISGLLKSRDLQAKVLYSFDFGDSEDRKARAKVDLIKIEIPRYSYKGKPFETFFEENFTYPEETKINFEEEFEKASLVCGSNIIERLCYLYNRRMIELRNNITAICDLDASLLKEFEITKAGLISSLEQKINNCKKEYWQRLFNNTDVIVNRLTRKSRSSILELMNAQTGVDFNRDNCYAIILWVIKNANKYFEEQFVDTYLRLLEYANVENYKSNKRVFDKDKFYYFNQYNRGFEDISHVKLKTGNRIVLSRCGGLRRSDYSFDKGLEEQAADFISDLMTIADSIGFTPIEKHPVRGEWNDNEAKTYTCYHNGEKCVLFTVRAFFNGNMHFTFNTDFVHKMNIHAGKLLGWIRNRDEVEEVVENKEEYKDFYDFSCKVEKSQLKLGL